MVRNPLPQLLCLVAMEPPLTLGERDLRDRQVSDDCWGGAAGRFLTSTHNVCVITM
ncbi:MULTISPECIES: hypothetical protein [unclassified Streptomyces]|uniref:hypothetical protein n=1 Tax=unclassified Streptomyces TaxID=2593676 RepID=UPI001FFDE86D|nr:MULTISPECIES: hypothetical protein [unclassified Streptomyces]